MTDRATERFWALYADLPHDVQILARKQFRLYQANPDHPSVNLKPLKHSKRPIWSARVSDQYRALAIRTLDQQGQAMMLWYWIGPHAEYDKITSRQ